MESLEENGFEKTEFNFVFTFSLFSLELDTKGWVKNELVFEDDSEAEVLDSAGDDLSKVSTASTFCLDFDFSVESVFPAFELENGLPKNELFLLFAVDSFSFSFDSFEEPANGLEKNELVLFDD